MNTKLWVGNCLPRALRRSATANMKKHTMRETTEEEEEEELILKQTSDLISKLPLEIIFDILARLPIKTLSQSCRWVSKSWFKIISHPRFAHAQHAKALQIFSPCVTYFNLGNKSFYLVDHQVFDNHKTSTTVHHPKISGFGWAYDVVGSCNGLVCMAPDHLCYKPQPYFIFNPITGDYINLPNSPMYKTVPYLSAFGFDIVANEYKVVRIMKSRKVEIYTLGSGPNGWRRISDVPHDIVGRDTAFVNGVLHWTFFNDSEDCYSIMALDMATEQFQEIPTPPVTATKGVGVFGGCLCFTDDESQAVAWVLVMKSYGVEESWSRENVFTKESFPFGDWNDGYEVLKLQNGEMLLKHKRDSSSTRNYYERDLLSYYDPAMMVYKPIVTNGIPSTVLSLRPIIHMGSLLSPKNIGRRAKKLTAF